MLTEITLAGDQDEVNARKHYIARLRAEKYAKLIARLKAPVIRACNYVTAKVSRAVSHRWGSRHVDDCGYFDIMEEEKEYREASELHQSQQKKSASGSIVKRKFTMPVSRGYLAIPVCAS